MADIVDTGFSDASYALVSVLYHTLQGIEVAEAYIEDAEDAEDEELAAFLREVMAEDRRRAAKAKALLLRRLSEGEVGADGTDGDEE
jgi:hypothetical protein